MAEVVITLLVALIVAVLGVLAKAGYISLPASSDARSLVGLGVLVAFGGLVFATADAGLKASLICWGPIILIGIVGLLFGLRFYLSRRKNGSDIQKTDLGG